MIPKGFAYSGLQVLQAFAEKFSSIREPELIKELCSNEAALLEALWLHGLLPVIFSHGWEEKFIEASFASVVTLEWLLDKFEMRDLQSISDKSSREKAVIRVWFRAAEEMNEKIRELLIERKFPIDYRDNESGYTALHLSCLNIPSQASIFLEKGADPNIRPLGWVHKGYLGLSHMSYQEIEKRYLCHCSRRTLLHRLWKEEQSDFPGSKHLEAYNDKQLLDGTVAVDAPLGSCIGHPRDAKTPLIVHALHAAEDAEKDSDVIQCFSIIVYLLGKGASLTFLSYTGTLLDKSDRLFKRIKEWTHSCFINDDFQKFAILIPTIDHKAAFPNHSIHSLLRLAIECDCPKITTHLLKNGAELEKAYATNSAVIIDDLKAITRPCDTTVLEIEPVKEFLFANEESPILTAKERNFSLHGKIYVIPKGFAYPGLQVLKDFADFFHQKAVEKGNNEGASEEDELSEKPYFDDIVLREKLWEYNLLPIIFKASMNHICQKILVERLWGQEELSSSEYDYFKEYADEQLLAQVVDIDAPIECEMDDDSKISEPLIAIAVHSYCVLFPEDDRHSLFIRTLIQRNAKMATANTNIFQELSDAVDSHEEQEEKEKIQTLHGKMVQDFKAYHVRKFFYLKEAMLCLENVEIALIHTIYSLSIENYAREALAYKSSMGVIK